MQSVLNLSVFQRQRAREGETEILRKRERAIQGQRERGIERERRREV